MHPQNTDWIRFLSLNALLSSFHVFCFVKTKGLTL